MGSPAHSDVVQCAFTLEREFSGDIGRSPKIVAQHGAATSNVRKGVFIGTPHLARVVDVRPKKDVAATHNKGAPRTTCVR